MPPPERVSNDSPGVCEAFRKSAPDDFPQRNPVSRVRSGNEHSQLVLTDETRQLLPYERRVETALLRAPVCSSSNL